MNRKGKRRKEVNSHISLQAIRQYLLHGKYPSNCSPTDKRGIRKRSESFKLEGDDLFYIARPKRLDEEPIDPNPAADKNNHRKAILTVREQLAVTARAHVSETGVHKGTERTLHGVSSQYYWVGMSATARQVVKSCIFCLTRQDVSSTQVASSVSNDTQPSHTESQTENNVKEESTLMVDGENITAEVNELPFKVTSQVDNPVEEDPDLNFDVGAIFCNEHNLVADSEIIKAHRFWERVEIAVISPTAGNKKEDGRGRHKNYTIIAVDSFSKWPEAKKLDKLNEQTISQFIIQLISRFGIMNQLVFLENDILIEQSMIITGITQNLNMFNVVVISESYNPYDKNWTRICKCVSQFVQNHPSTWSSCLDLCLMPLRNSVAPSTDYSPAFVVTGREPVFPSFLFPHKDSSNNAEMLLNQDQIVFAADTLMNKYQDCCEADVKQIIMPFDSNSFNSKDTSYSVKDELLGVRRSGRKVTVSQRLTDYEHLAPMSVIAEEDTNVDHSDNDGTAGEDVEQPDHPKRVKYADVSNTHEVPESSDNVNVINTRNESGSKVNYFNRKNYDGEDFLNKLDSCTFYQVLRLYIEKSQYPLNSPVTFKRVVRKAREMYSLEGGKLVYNHKNKTKKLVLTTMKERLHVLNEIHTSSEDHVPRSRMLDLIEQKRVYWKNLGGDVDAYVKACPDCKHGKPRPRIKKKWQENTDSNDEDDWCVGEKYQGSVSSFFPDLYEFLDSGVGPSHLSRSELVLFKKKAKNFKLVKGELFYKSSSAATKSKSRKVLVNEDQKLAVIRKAHGATHKPSSAMLAEIKQHYCWRPMRKDIDSYVANCCQTENEVHKDNIDNELNQKVEIFEKHFRGENICGGPTDLDSLFPDTSLEMANSNSLDDKTGQLMAKTGQGEEIFSGESLRLPTIINDVGASADQQTTSAVSSSEDQLPAISLDSAFTGPSVPQTTVKQSSQKEETKKDDEMLSVQIVMADKLSQLEQSVDEVDDDGEEVEEGESEKAYLLQVPCLNKKNISGVKMRCEVCKKIIRGENNFKEHMYKHDGVKPFSCEICNKKLTTVKGMRMHMRKHTGHRPFLCNICGRGFPRSASLRYHIKTHDKGTTVPVSCDICNRQFSTEHRMLKHKRFKHPEKRPVWKCDACGKHFTAKRSLKRHEEAHQGIRRYECEFCKRSFFRKEYLTYHVESHYKGNPSMAHLASKRKRRLIQRQMSGKDEHANILSIYTVEPDIGPEKMYTQLVEVTNPHGWTEGGVEGPTVFTLEGESLQVSDRGTIQVREVISQTDPGTTLVMVEEGVTLTSSIDNHNQELEIGQIIMASNLNSQQTAAQPNQIHLAIPAGQPSIQQTGDDITLKTTSTTATTATVAASTPLVESSDLVHEPQPHNNIQTIKVELPQGDQIKVEQNIDQQQQDQDQPVTILSDLTTSSTSTTDSSIIIPSENSSGRIEVRMSNGQKLTLSKTDDGAVGSESVGQSGEIVHYRVECLDGETLTEEHLNALRMLTQTSSLIQP